jgi:hypothetical protein
MTKAPYKMGFYKLCFIAKFMIRQCTDKDFKISIALALQFIGAVIGGIKFRKIKKRYQTLSGQSHIR